MFLNKILCYNCISKILWSETAARTFLYSTCKPWKMFDNSLTTSVYLFTSLYHNSLAKETFRISTRLKNRKRPWGCFIQLKVHLGSVVAQRQFNDRNRWNKTKNMCTYTSGLIGYVFRCMYTNMFVMYVFISACMDIF